MLPAFFTTVLFSLSAVSGSISSRLVGGMNANFCRLLFGTVLLGLAAHLWGGGFSGGSLWWFLFSGAVGFGVGDTAVFQSLPRIGSRLTMVLVLCVSPPMAAVAEWLWMGTRLSLPEIGCALLILAGVGIALAPDRTQKIPRRTFWIGTAFGMVASACQAGGSVLSRKAFSLAAMTGEDIGGPTAAYQRIVGGVAVALVFLIIARHRLWLAWWWERRDAAARGLGAHRWRRATPWILFNGLVGPALGVSCFQWALKIAPTGVVLPILALTPVVIIPFSRFLEGERPTRRSLLGGLLAVLGAAFLARLASH